MSTIAEIYTLTRDEVRQQFPDLVNVDNFTIDLYIESAVQYIDNYLSRDDFTEVPASINLAIFHLVKHYHNRKESDYKLITSRRAGSIAETYSEEDLGKELELLLSELLSPHKNYCIIL